MVARALQLFLAVLALSLTGCGVTKTSREAHPPGGASPLLETSDARIAVALDAVVVRNAPGSWERNAAWDEYRFRVRSISGADLRLVRITLFDAQGQAVESSAEVRALNAATAEVQKRYDAAGQRVCRASVWVPAAAELLAGGGCSSRNGGVGPFARSHCSRDRRDRADQLGPRAQTHAAAGSDRTCRIRSGRLLPYGSAAVGG